MANRPRDPSTNEEVIVVSEELANTLDHLPEVAHHSTSSSSVETKTSPTLAEYVDSLSETNNDSSHNDPIQQKKS